MNRAALYFIAAMLSLMFGMWLATPAEDKITYVKVVHPTSYTHAEIDAANAIVAFRVHTEEITTYHKPKPVHKVTPSKSASLRLMPRLYRAAGSKFEQIADNNELSDEQKQTMLWGDYTRKSSINFERGEGK
jgi:hypothetical protein